MSPQEREETRAAMLEAARITRENARVLERANLKRGARLLEERARREERLAGVLAPDSLERGMVREEVTK
jgi:hypothetical protein